MKSKWFNLLKQLRSRKVRIILNFLPIQSGGGLQNALSFISNLPYDSRILCLARYRSDIDNSLRARGFMVLVARNNASSRMVIELLVSILAVRGTVCFTLFGPRPIGSHRLYNIAGFAYSNLLYPECDFWGWCGSLDKMRRRLIDYYRFWSAKTCDELIFETDALFHKAKKNLEFRNTVLHVVHMAPSAVMASASDLDDGVGRAIDQLSKRDLAIILYLSSAHPNKRIHLLPDILAADSSKKFAFAVTLPADHWYTREIYSKAESYGVVDRLINLGPIPSSQVGCVLDRAAGVINIARLESFSNNWVEAWATSKPLIVTDADWARSSCREGACYIDPDKPGDAALQISRVLLDEQVRETLVKSGKTILLSYPTPDQKTRQMLEIINKRIVINIGEEASSR